MEKGYNPKNGIVFLCSIGYDVNPILFDSFKNIFYYTCKRNNFEFTNPYEFFYSSIRAYITLSLGENGHETLEGEEKLIKIMEEAGRRMHQAGFIEMVKKGLTLDEILKRKIN